MATYILKDRNERVMAVRMPDTMPVGEALTALRARSRMYAVDMYPDGRPDLAQRVLSSR